MKFTIKKEILLIALNRVSKAISTKNIIPVLSGIKFEIKKNKLTLTASDNDISIETFITLNENNATIEKEGKIIIQGKYILDIVRKIQDEFINIEVLDELKILIYTKNSEFNLNGISESEYPNIGLEESKKVIKLKTEVLKTLVNQTAFAASSEESKPVLTGINFNIAGNILECNSTNSYRLAKKVVKLEQEVDENYNIIIPSHNIIELIKILSDDEYIYIHIFKSKVLFTNENMKFQSRLINGTYPNVSNFIPTETFLTVTVDLNNFYNVIDRVSILSSDKDKNVVTLDTKENTLNLKSSTAEIGRVEEKMNITKNNSEEISISFSSKYMMEALKTFSGKTVDIHFVGGIKPILLNSTDDAGLTQLVVPMRTY